MFQLISTTWERVYPQDEFEAPGWIRHEPINLRIKSLWANTTSRADTAAAMDMDAEPAGIGCGLRLDARTLVVAG